MPNSLRSGQWTRAIGHYFSFESTAPRLGWKACALRFNAMAGKTLMSALIRCRRRLRKNGRTRTTCPRRGPASPESKPMSEGSLKTCPKRLSQYGLSTRQQAVFTLIGQTLFGGRVPNSAHLRALSLKPVPSRGCRHSRPSRDNTVQYTWYNISFFFPNNRCAETHP